MRALNRLFVVLACLVVLPGVSLRAGDAGGNGQDGSGAVLPGVTVEAASPALIRKSPNGGDRRHAASTASPSCRRALTCSPSTLSGFSTVKREGVEVTRFRRHPDQLAHARRRPSPRRSP